MDNILDEFKRLGTILDSKVKPLVDAIEKADPTSKDFGELLANYGLLMDVASNVNRILIAFKAQAEASKKVKVEGEK